MQRAPRQVRFVPQADLRWPELSVAGAWKAGRVIQSVRNMLIIEEGKRFLGIIPAVAEDAMGAKARVKRIIEVMNIGSADRSLRSVERLHFAKPARLQPGGLML
jgi:hypothetical protein